MTALTPAQELRAASHALLTQPDLTRFVAGRNLARWLEAVADLHEAHNCEKHEGCDPLGCQWCNDEDWPCADVRNALDTARTVLAATACPTCGGDGYHQIGCQAVAE